MALMGGHRFAVSMEDLFPHGVYALGVEQAMDYDPARKASTPAKDKQTGELVWTVTCIDRDPDVRQKQKQVQVKVLAPYCPELPEEIAPGSGIRAVEFSGLSVTPWVDEGRGKPRLAYSFRATGVHPQGKAPSNTPGRRNSGSPAGSGEQPAAA